MGETGAVTRLPEDLQLSLDEGACTAAAHSCRPVPAPDLHHDRHTARWPLTAAAVAGRTAAGAQFALPAQRGAVTIGVLDLCRIAPDPTADDRWSCLAAVADTTTRLLLVHRTPPGSDREAGVPPGPLDTVPDGRTARWPGETGRRREAGRRPRGRRPAARVHRGDPVTTPRPGGAS